MRQDIAAKQLQMLKEAIPKATKIAVLQQTEYNLHLQQMAEIGSGSILIVTTSIQFAVAIRPSRRAARIGERCRVAAHAWRNRVGRPLPGGGALLPLDNGPRDRCVIPLSHQCLTAELGRLRFPILQHRTISASDHSLLVTPAAMPG